MQQVLIVDHEKKHLLNLVNYLKKFNIEIVTCIESQAAETLLQYKTFDIVISDISISSYGGLEGLKLIRHIANHFPKTNVIALSNPAGLET